MKTTSFLHDGTIGDVWASLPALKEFHRKTGHKIVLYLTSGQRAKYYKGATHPTRDKNGKMVMLNDEMIKMMIPLLKAQYYIYDAKKHKGEEINYDLNTIRSTFTNMPNHPLQKWYFYVYPDTTCDLGEQYIEVPDLKKNLAKNKIIVCKTQRYPSYQVTFDFLKDYEDKVIFAGTTKEHKLFCKKYKLSIPLLKIKNFLELAQALKQSNGLLSNQTMIFQIAEGMKTPRAVALHKHAPNVTTFGKNGYEGYSQESIEYFFHLMNNSLIDYWNKHMGIKKAATSSLSSFKSKGFPKR